MVLGHNPVFCECRDVLNKVKATKIEYKDDYRVSKKTAPLWFPKNLSSKYTKLNSFIVFSLAMSM